ncbi:sulfatase-like hydrolase/transferase [Chloroflexi bacterium TSY]|nr:sulfatase-like hydrolase/transferase [Chloroflexi bacterium TSY]
MKTSPNVLWIYCDELRTDALGCYGNPYTDIQTPHIDSIAERGVRFDNCFCNSPVCVASRAAILTGLYPHQTGIYHNEAVWPNYQFAQQFPEGFQTIPSVLAENGYQTANFGKVHVPKALQHWGHSNPVGSGMQEFFQEIDPATLQMIRPPGIPTVVGGIYPGDRPYPPTQVTDNTIEWIDLRDEPWLARVSYLQPHTPVFPPPPHDTQYLKANFPDHAELNPALSQFEQRFAEIIGTHKMSGRDLFLAHVYYYGLVAWIDEQVGRLLDYLRRHGQLERTIIIFESDHGASLGEWGRFQKQTFAPESHRVPRLISWAGTLAGGQTREDISESLDLARTLFSLLELETPTQFNGRDLFNDSAPEAVYASIGYGFSDSRSFPNLGVGDYGDEHGWPRRACIRTERYRLDKNVRLDGEAVDAAHEDVFLTDVLADPSESQNLAANPTLANVVIRLSGLLDTHLDGAVEVPQAWTQRNEKAVS